MPDIGLKCRLCLGSVRGQGIDLFRGEDGLNYSVHMGLMMMLSVELEEIPEWPRKACLDCVIMLKKIVKFRCSVIANNNRLRLTGTSQVKEPETTVPDLLVALQRNQLWLDDGEEEEFIKPALHIDVVDLTTSGPSQPKIIAKPLDINPHPQPSSSATALFSSSSEGEGDSLSSDSLDFSSDSETDSISSLELGPPPVKHPRILPAKLPTMAPKRALSKPQPPVRKPEKVSLVRFNSNVLSKDEERLEAQMVEMRLLVCKECNKDCESLPGLRRHVREQHQTVNYVFCCDRLLSNLNATSIYQHLLRHQFECKFCAESYPDAASLTKHLALPHPEEVGPFICEVCGEGFDNRTGLSKHMTEHNKLACEYCQKEFKRRSSLRLHILEKHQKVVNVLCHLCGKGFATQHRLKQHLNDHGGPDKPRRVRIDTRRYRYNPNRKRKRVTPFWSG